MPKLEFCRARGDLPLPQPASIGHKPSEEHIDGLTAKAFWDDVTSFPWAAELEDNAHVVIKEFEQQLLQQKEETKTDDGVLFSGDSAWQSKVMGAGWSAFRLQRLGVWNPENCAKFPQTYDLLNALNIPLAVRGVCFARQSPGSGVAPHSDGRNFILTSHLGLKIPEGTFVEESYVASVRCALSTIFFSIKLRVLDQSRRRTTALGRRKANHDRYIVRALYWEPFR